MAPSRKRGASKAAAAAAAQRKWKVGDLVLAKVKGFPAWPATVSEPEKWDQPVDWKKVFVHFFGTGQIGFCHPVDVEEFTEDKKVSLLGKRHGKGADFVRAVNEIIDCFENAKKQDQVSTIDATEETSITTNFKSTGPLTKPEKDVVPVVAVKSLATEAVVALAAEVASRHDESQIKAENSDLLYTETPLPKRFTTRSKTDAQSHNGTHRMISARKLRWSSRADASRLQNVTSRRSRSNSLRDRSLRRSKRFVKCSDDSEGNNTDSPSSSNDSVEENDSGTMTVDDSDIRSYNDVSSVESGHKPVETKPDNDGETELNDKLDFQNKTVIIKKKRRPNRKKLTSDTVVTAKGNVVVSEAETLKPEPVSPVNNEKSVKRLTEAEMLKHERVSPINNEKSVKRLSKDDGDEHLPLVKRARIRMGGTLPAVEQESVHKEEKVLPILESGGTQLSRPFNHNDDVGKYVPVKGDRPNLSLSHQSPPKKPLFGDSRKSFADDEAALPPSKRLHRALEAMSANVAENSRRASNCSPHSNERSSSLLQSSELAMENKARTELGSEPVVDHKNDDSYSQFSASDFGVLSDNIAKNSAVVSTACGITCSVNSSGSGLDKDSLDHVEGTGSKCMRMSPLNEQPSEIVADQYVKPSSLTNFEELSSLGCKIDCSQLNKDVKGPDPEILQLSTAVNSHEAQETKCHPFAETDKSCHRSESVEEVIPVSMDTNGKPSPTPVKALVSSSRRSLLHSDPVSDGLCSVPKASIPSSSTRFISQSESYIENNGSCSSNVQLHLEKSTLAGKLSTKDEYLSSFESSIKSLTRTKESIGRATRIAIDCAKFGYATKVVEILARSLEKESSSHKKVDLFFLVDSITQFSRGIKGDGGVYPSTIQALLPRLLLAAAPPGSSSSHENHRQCLKVLKVWQERKIIPEPIIHHHIQELDALCGTYPTVGSRRALRNERAFDDPIREMEGMLVDEYGSNSSIQFPGFCMPPMLKDDDGGSDSDGESFEAVTPEHNVENLDIEETLIEKRSHILEDVDGELEMEDVAPCYDVEMASVSNVVTAVTQLPHHQSDKHYAPLPRSLPPPPPQPPCPIPPPVFPPAECDSMPNGPESKHYLSSQNFNFNARESMPKHSPFPRSKQAPLNSTHHHHHRTHEYRDFEAQVPRHIPDNSNTCFSDRPNSHLSGRANGIQQADFNKGFHLRPPHPTPSNQFSYVQEQRSQSQRDMPPPPNHPNRFHARNAEHGNFYGDREPRDNIGECWRPPLPSISGSGYQDGGRMAHAPASYGGPPREPPAPNNRWNYRPRFTNHRHFNPYRPPSEGPIPVANRGPAWRPR